VTYHSHGNRTKVTNPQPLLSKTTSCRYSGATQSDVRVAVFGDMGLATTVGNYGSLLRTYAVLHRKKVFLKHRQACHHPAHSIDDR
jgi:hypothetical protein